jgi:ElaB/YqjD/DUF883 family membrane-anchored ribosome-binding protein
MSITSDLRAYADKAQAQLNDVTGQANEFVTKFAGPVKENVSELRAQAEKAINLDAVKTAVEPYLDQVKNYRAAVTEKAEALFEQVKSDPRVKQLVDVVEERVVKPVRTLVNRGGKPATPAKSAAKPVAAKPTPVKAAAKPARKVTARKTTAKAVRKPAATKA